MAMLHYFDKGNILESKNKL